MSGFAGGHLTIMKHRIRTSCIRGSHIYQSMCRHWNSHTHTYTCAHRYRHHERKGSSQTIGLPATHKTQSSPQKPERYLTCCLLFGFPCGRFLTTTTGLWFRICFTIFSNILDIFFFQRCCFRLKLL